jgi:hypothetical protein
VTILRFDGIVTRGEDPCRVDSQETQGAVRVGDRDLVEEVSETTWSGPVTVALADERYSGDLAYELGWGYSEYTPMDADELTVGPHDVIEILLRHEDKSLTVWVADEPFNTLDPPAHRKATCPTP